MAKYLEIEIDKNYELNGSIFKLIGVAGNFFTLIPIMLNGTYCTNEDGYVVMNAKFFFNAKIV